MRSPMLTIVGSLVFLALGVGSDPLQAQEKRERLMWMTPAPSGKAVFPLAFTPDGKQILVQIRDKSFTDEEAPLALWNTENGKDSLTLEGSPKALLASWTVSANGQRLLVGTGDCISGRKGKQFGPVDVSLRAWDLTTGKELPPLEGHTAPIYACALSSDGKIGVSCSSGFINSKPHPDLTIRLWNMDTGKELRRLKESQPVYATAFTPDGKQLVTVAHNPKLKGGQGQSTFRVWDVANGKSMRTFVGPAVHQGQSRLFFLPKIDQFAVVTAQVSDAAVSTWNFRAGTRLRTTFVPGGNAFSLSGDGRFAISAQTGPVRAGKLTLKDAPDVTVWDVQKSTAKATWPALRFFEGIVNTPAWFEIAQKRVGYPLLSPDGRQALVVNGDRVLMLALPW